MEGSAVNCKDSSIFKVFTLDEVFSVSLSRLVKSKSSWELLSIQVHGEDMFSTTKKGISLKRKIYKEKYSFG